MAHVHTRRWRISRRHALRSMGVSIALPFLDCMHDRVGRPKRCVFVYVPNGFNVLTWQITTAGRDYALSPALAGLTRHRDRITPISGLHHPTGIGKAHKCARIWLTGATLDNEQRPTSVSADQLMADVTGMHTRFRSLELAVTGGTLSWTRDGVPLPSQRSPKAVFDRLFGATRGGVERARSRLARRASILDLVLDRAKELRKRVGRDDRTRLDEYLTAVRDVEIRTQHAEHWLDVPKPRVDAGTRARFAVRPPLSAAGDTYAMFYDLVVLALRTDMTRVITFMTGSESHGLAIPEIGIHQTRHELSHHGGIREKMDRLTRCDAFLTRHFARFLDRLAEHDEAGEPLLDRTIVLYGSGMSYGHNHGNANLPLVLAGGRGLGLAHGRHVDKNLPRIGKYDLAHPHEHYRICLRPADSRARASSLLLTLLQRMDVAVDRFADSLGPMSEIVS